MVLPIEQMLWNLRCKSSPSTHTRTHTIRYMHVCGCTRTQHNPPTPLPTPPIPLPLSSYCHSSPSPTPPTLPQLALPRACHVALHSPWHFHSGCANSAASGRRQLERPRKQAGRQTGRHAADSMWTFSFCASASSTLVLPKTWAVFLCDP